MDNNSLENFFRNSRGPWQWDPMSLLLFDIIMDVFFRLVHRTEKLELLQGCCPGEHNPMVTLIQYADDFLFLK